MLKTDIAKIKHQSMHSVAAKGSMYVLENIKQISIILKIPR